MIKRMDDILNHIEEYELEGGKRYLYHTEGCTVAPTVNLEDAAEIIYQLKITLEEIRDWIADPFVDVELTDREHEVMTLASRGVSVITIAGRLGVGRQTVYEEVWRSLVKINKVRDCELNLENLSEETFRQLERIVS